MSTSGASTNNSLFKKVLLLAISDAAAMGFVSALCMSVSYLVRGFSVDSVWQTVIGWPFLRGALVVAFIAAMASLFATYKASFLNTTYKRSGPRVAMFIAGLAIATITIFLMAAPSIDWLTAIMLCLATGPAFAPLGYRWLGFVKPTKSNDAPDPELGETLRTIRRTGRP
jgi:hypothetical protein